MNLDVSDFEQCSKLIWSIAEKEYFKYQIRVSYTKLDKEDFYQNGWVALQDCINKGISDLSYVCVAIRNSMYRGVEKTSIIQTTNKKELWHYISGHESRMEDIVSEGITLQDTFYSDESLEDKVINMLLVGQVFENISKEDKIEVLRIMNNLPPLRRKVRENCKKRARERLGVTEYSKRVAKLQSNIKCVSYDKSKDKWLFKQKINGAYKTLVRDRDQHIVEEFAINYYNNEGIGSEEYIKVSI